TKAESVDLLLGISTKEEVAGFLVSTNSQLVWETAKVAVIMAKILHFGRTGVTVGTILALMLGM
ncbi:hypothetical protein AB9F41_36195, partial [Rhizobium leguminosarum]|uniref:hypothetical protein n=1 Tax=Rhizobium leguminosarum TaxID=384 RepID=UPI003F982A8C